MASVAAAAPSHRGGHLVLGESSSSAGGGTGGGTTSLLLPTIHGETREIPGLSILLGPDTTQQHHQHDRDPNYGGNEYALATARYDSQQQLSGAKCPSMLQPIQDEHFEAAWINPDDSARDPDQQRGKTEIVVHYAVPGG